MEKNFKANIDYNRKKRRNAITLIVIYTLLMGGFLAFMLIKQSYQLISIFAVFVIFPFILIPSILKNYPVKDIPLIQLYDKTFKVNDVEYKIKDIVKINVNIELPASKLDSENKKTLEEVAVKKAEDVYMGSFDIVVPGKNGKNEVLYNTIDHVIDALISFIDSGVKYYTLSYTIKKQTVKSVYDYKKDLDLVKEKEKEVAKISKKDKIKQLI